MATLQDIAQAAGVSVDTAGRALRGEIKGVRMDAVRRARRIRRIARRLGYRPNAAARAMAVGRFGAAGLLCRWDGRTSHTSERLLSALHCALSAHDMHLTLAQATDDDLASRTGLPKLLRECMVDGLLVNYHVGTPDATLAIAEELQIPAVWINADLPRDCVRVGDAQATREATRRLVALGHRRIAYADYVHDPEQSGTWHYSVRDRQAGYEQAMREAGLKPRVFRQSPTAARGPLTFTRDWLCASDRPTALVSYGPVEATTALFAAGQHGLRVGRDLSLLPVTEDAARVAGIPLSSVRIPWSQVGTQAVEMLLQRIANPTESLPARTVPCVFQEGQTLGPVSSA